MIRNINNRLYKNQFYPERFVCVLGLKKMMGFQSYVKVEI